MVGFAERELALRLLAWAATLRAIKPTKKATRKCRKRRERAVILLIGDFTPHISRHDVRPEEAITFLRRSCRTCGKCKGV